MILYIIATALIRTVATFVNKILAQKGISRFDYFFYMCFSMLPFAVLMMLSESFKFQLHWIPVTLLVVSAVLRYWQQQSMLGMFRKLEPFQYQTYLSMGIVFTYIIDCFLGTKILTWQGVLSILLVLAGVSLIGNLKFEFAGLNKDILLCVFCEIFQGYIVFYILKYWSNAFYIFSLNFILTLIFTPKYTHEKHINRSEILKWVFIQQTFGFSAVYLYNLLTAHSVTSAIYTYPTAIILSYLFSFFKNYSGKSLRFQNVATIVMVGAGILLLK